jgi:hypothetical protein
VRGHIGNPPRQGPVVGTAERVCVTVAPGRSAVMRQNRTGQLTVTVTPSPLATTCPVMMPGWMPPPTPTTPESNRATKIVLKGFRWLRVVREGYRRLT